MINKMLENLNRLVIFIALITISLGVNGQTTPDSLQFPITNSQDPTGTKPQSFDLGDPSNVQQTIVYDPKTGKYIFKETLNGTNFRNPSMMTLEEYMEYERQKQMADYWKEKIDTQTEEESQPLIPPIKIENPGFANVFGSDEINIRPQGSVELSFGVNTSRYDNPILPEKQRRITRFDFQQKIQLNLVGQIGTKLKLSTSYNTEAAFDFDNVTKLEYTGDEDQIIQKIEAGNVSMPLNTSLIQGSQTLFGLKTRLKFGRLTVDAIASTSKGRKQEINISGGAQVQQFEVEADNYEANRHYFLNYYHRESYDDAMATVPYISSLINITRIEVWVTNRQNKVDDTRNIIAFTDLGEAKQENWEGNPGGASADLIPDNSANNLYDWASNNAQVRSFTGAVVALQSQGTAPGPFQQALEYEKVENARKLTEQEFSYNSQLGFISLNLPLNNDEVLAVAYEYTLRGDTYQVGELSTDGVVGQEALLLKLLKPTITNPNNKLWDLMMKNVYSLGAYQLDQQGFRLDILYNNPDNSLPINFMPYPGLDEDQIITTVEMDRLNQNNRNQPDGVFDFVPINFEGNRAVNGGTVNARNGRVYFSTVEPFGQTLKEKMEGVGLSPTIVDNVAFTELYDSTKTAAQQIPSKNRFFFKGEYQSSVSADIPLNALNVPEGAVTVTAGGIRLVEGTDYTVDYNLGRVKILNTGILESNTPIKIDIESQSVFGFQSKSLVGAHFNYMFNPDFNIGATWMNMTEKPVTQKVDIGDEPFSNHIIGMDLAYRTEVPLITKLVDLLPVISTKAKSTVSINAEVARFIPGTPRAISKEGISYVDDFEGSQSTIDLRTFASWKLASIPQGQPDLFPEAALKDNLSAGFNRSKLAWYVIDPLFYQDNSLTPDNIKESPELIEDCRVSLVNQTDVFPNLNPALGTISNIPVFDLAYYPKERGMYNYDTTNTVDANGDFINPEDRWAGIMRSLSTTDFEQTNVEFIQFWVMDPFNQDAEDVNPNTTHTGGDLYFNLGNVSEDILPDSRKSFENGLPADGNGTNLDTTNFARVSTEQVVVNAFDTDVNSRVNQDVGLDGWNDLQERNNFPAYIAWINSNPTLSAAAKARLLADPSSDDFNYYRDDVYDANDFDILQRYKRYNGHEGNSPTSEMSDTANADGYPTQASNTPDIEDINQDNNLSESESYFQYKISLRPQDMVVGQNYITNERVYTEGTKTKRWYQFKVPIRTPDKVVNGINDFRSIRFMRMFLKSFDEEVVVRFARLELIRGEWRKYLLDLTAPGDGVVTDPDLTVFNIGAVNVEENDQKQPINYVIPPGINREIDPAQTFQRQLNEQSLLLEVCGLEDGDARAAYRNVTFDVRSYKKLKMFVHAEEKDPASPLKDDDLTLFMRLGTDFVENYYEYEMPLKVTPWGATVDTEIWPEGNNLEVVFEDLLDAKQARNLASNNPNSSVTTTTEFVIEDPANAERQIKVKGNPNLQGVKTIMIGVRNPNANGDNPYKPDDALSKCAEVWINELRLTDFETKGSSAAIARVQAQLADFGSVQMAGSYYGTNWGSIESRVSERSRDTKMNFDMSTNLSLGQFFGKKAKISVPFFYSYSVGVVNPEYDPFNPDIRLSDYDDLATRKERAKLGQDFTERKSYNFTNVRKERGAGKKPMPWDISNFSVSYGYSENLRRDFNTEYDRTKLWKGGLNYTYAGQPKLVEPFKKIKFMKKSKWWGIIRDANFYLGPKSIGFQNNLQRSYNERKIRNTLGTSFEFRPIYLKNFTWDRKYTLKYDITKNLKFDFSASNAAIFDEPEGQVDKREDPDSYNVFRDSIQAQLGTLGKTMSYQHAYNLSYNVPFNKIPALDWVNSNIKLSSGYEWQRAALGQEAFGNTIQNNRNVSLTSQLNMTTLYNKIPFFKKINSNGRGGRRTVSRSSANRPSTDGKDDEKDPKDMTDKEKEKEKKKKEKEKAKKEREKARGGKVHPVLGFAGRMLMTVRTISGTYALNDGILLPGYNQDTRILGFSEGFDSPMAGFVFGQQQRNVFGQQTGFEFAPTAAANGWIVDTSALNREHTVTHSQNISLRASLEPLKDFKVDLTVTRTFAENMSEFFRFDDIDQQFESQSRFVTSNITYTTISIGSAFAALSKEYRTQTFDNLRNNRADVSTLLGVNNGNSSSSGEYYDGYGGSQQEVVIGAFLTSFTNRDINEKNINPFRNLPLPNWNITYNGLSKFNFMKKYVRNFTIRHAYASTVSLSGVQTNLNSEVDANGDLTARDINDNFISRNQVQNVTMSERFSPLIGFDATWIVNKNGLITKFEIKKERSAALSLTNNQVTEIRSSELVIGTGYKFGNVKLPLSFGGKPIPASDLNVRVDLSIRDNLTVIRKIVENTNQATAGQNVVSIRSSADYQMGKNLTVALYYDQTLTNPKVATSYPTGNTSAGIRLRFNLGGLQ